MSKRGQPGGTVVGEARMGGEPLPHGARLDDPRTVAERQADFLRELTQSFTVASAARKAGVDRSTPYGWRRNDSAFGEAWDRALAEGRKASADVLEDMLFEEAVTARNVLPAFFLLKKLDPSYRDNAPVQHSVGPAILGIRWQSASEAASVIDGQYRALPALPEHRGASDDQHEPAQTENGVTTMALRWEGTSDADTPYS